MRDGKSARELLKELRDKLTEPAVNGYYGPWTISFDKEIFPGLTLEQKNLIMVLVHERYNSFIERLTPILDEIEWKLTPKSKRTRHQEESR